MRPDGDAVVHALVVAISHAVDDHLDAPGRRAGRVHQPDAHGLLRLEPDLGHRFLGVGVQLDPAEPVPGRGGHRMHLENAARPGAGRVELEPAVGVGLGLAQHGRAGRPRRSQRPEASGSA